MNKMSNVVSYTVSSADRMRYAAAFDRLQRPATHKDQREWARANPDAHLLMVQRVFNGLILNQTIVEMPRYKFMLCKHVERQGSCPRKDSCNFVHTAVYKDAISCYRRVHGASQSREQTPSLPQGERSTPSVESSPPTSPSPSLEGPGSQAPSVEERAFVSLEPVSFVSPPIPARVGAPLSAVPNTFGPRFGMPPVVIIDDAPQYTKRTPRNILFGIDVDLSWMRKV